MEDFENVAARERGEWEENNVLAALDLISKGPQRMEDALIDQYNSTADDQYSRVMADWDRWGDEGFEWY